MSEPLHLVDTTMFWSATGGGVRRYLLDQARLAGAPPRLAPHDRGSARRRQRRRRGDACRRSPLPGSGGYRLPLRRGRDRAGPAGLGPT